MAVDTALVVRPIPTSTTVLLAGLELEPGECGAELLEASKDLTRGTSHLETFVGILKKLFSRDRRLLVQDNWPEAEESVGDGNSAGQDADNFRQYMSQTSSSGAGHSSFEQ